MTNENFFVGTGNAQPVIAKLDDLFDHLSLVAALHPPKFIAVQGYAWTPSAVQRFLNSTNSSYYEINQPLNRALGCYTHYTYSIKAESGFTRPEILKKAWPNLQAIDEINLDCTTLDDLFAEANDTPISSCNWLILQSLDSVDILYGATQSCRDRLDLILCRSWVIPPEKNKVLVNPLNKKPFMPEDLSEDSSCEDGISIESEIESEQSPSDLLVPLGYKLLVTYPDRHPAHQWQVFVQNQRQLEQIKQEAAKAVELESRRMAEEASKMAAQLRALEAKLDKANQDFIKEKAELEKVIETERSLAQDKLIQAKQEAAKAVELESRLMAEEASKMAAQLRTLEAKLDKANQDFIKEKAELEKAIEAERSIKKDISLKLSSLEKELEGSIAKLNSTIQGKELELVAQLKSNFEIHLNKQLTSSKENLNEMETRIRNDLKNGLNNSVKQIESFLRIQNFLGADSGVGDFHGWPISPDIGVFLIEKMREQHYDLIIEFGSGTSTALFAKTAEVLAQKALTNQGKLAADVSVVAPTTEIVSFEHDSLYYTKTLQILKARGLENRVRLMHSPLIDWRDGEQNYLFYDCESLLAELSRKYANQKINILLLVDGPPGPTCLNARYPGVPLVFTALGRHRIDVVLDDASRPEELAIIGLWRKFWSKRSYRVLENTLSSEKGIYYSKSQ